MPPFMSVADALHWFFGDNPEIKGPELLGDTPGRWMAAYREMLSGYRVDPDVILKLFEYNPGGMVISSDIRFTSVCEHHLLPFFGTVSIGYLADKVIGLSKMSRLVDCLSKRLQLQERLTDQIANTIMNCKELKADGVGVIIRAQHTCQTCRGVEQQDAVMKTSAMLGFFRDKPEVRAEFIQLEKD